MKSWLRTRKGSPDSSTSREPKLQSNDISRSPDLKGFHVWSTARDSGSLSETPSLFGTPQTRTTAPLTPTSEQEVARNGKDNFSIEKPPLLKSRDLELLNGYGEKIQMTTSSGQVPKNVLISSEHYFRLALESYEQLKASHYRASQEFSLAEWLHIHALLLYGRIQHVRKAVDAGNVSPHNQVDLSYDVSVFAPIATAINAIGTVEDEESGIVYIPDAVFPSVSLNNSSSESLRISEYSTQEMQQILSGVLYDWQRSWRRVIEAREERNSRNTKFRMLRSSSELISAIREATDSIAKIRNNQKVLSPMLEQQADEEAAQGNEPQGGQAKQIEQTEQTEHDYQGGGSELGRYTAELAGHEQQLLQLFEEARNAKDYTLRPPCDRVYNWEASTSTSTIRPPSMRMQPFNLRNRESYVDSAANEAFLNRNSVRNSVRNSPEERPSREDSHVVDNPANNSVDGFADSMPSSVPPLMYDSDSVSTIHTAEPEDLDDQLKPVSTTVQKQLSITGQPEAVSETYVSLDPRQRETKAVVEYQPRQATPTQAATTQAVQENPLERKESTVETKEGSTKPGILKPSKQVVPMYAVPPIRSARRPETSASPPSRSAMRKPPILRGSPESSPSSIKMPTPPHHLYPQQEGQRESQHENRRENRHDNQEPGSSKAKVKIGGSSDYLDCFVHYDSQLWQDYNTFIKALKEKNLAKFSQLKTSPKGSYAWLVPVKVNYASADRSPRLVLPRKSIPKSDQALALVLQTCHTSPKLLETWHHNAVANVDLKELLTEYVLTAINQ